MILDCPEAVDEILTDLYDDDSFLESSAYLGAFERYGDTVERMGAPLVAAGTSCFVELGDASCQVDAASPSCDA